MTVLILLTLGVNILLVLNIFTKITTHRETMSFLIHNEDRKLFSRISQDLTLKLGFDRSEEERELHPLFQFISALYKQKKFGNINDKDWSAMEAGLSFLINSGVGGAYWKKINRQLWPKDFIELGNSLISTAR